MNELSEFLKSERLKRDLTVEFFSRQSGISLSMLLAFESGNCESFAASLLIRNTVRVYCKVLGIDPEPLIEKYASEIEKFNIQEAGIIRFGREMKILRKKRRMIGFPLFLLTLATIGIVYGASWISEKRSRLYAPPAADRIFTQEELPVELQEKLALSAKPGPREVRRDQAGLTKSTRSDSASRDADKALQLAEKNISDAEKSRAAQGRAPLVEAPQQVQAPQVEPAQPVASTSGVPTQLALSNSTEAVAEDRTGPLPEPSLQSKFSVEADDKVWIQVRIDDKVTRSTMLLPGDKREWAAEKSMQVIVGNAGGIRMKWNDQAVKAPRDSGRVLRMRFPEYARESE
ncbi:MAG: DUF4115 domain-containing protein [Desulfobacteraceae bacterium]|nr:DUF4115 domain-containing protein [Desulfobacteraceae bacterium]